MTRHQQVRLDIIRALLRRRASAGSAGADSGLAGILVCDDWHQDAEQDPPRPPEPRRP